MEATAELEPLDAVLDVRLEPWQWQLARALSRYSLQYDWGRSYSTVTSGRLRTFLTRPDKVPSFGSSL